MFRVEDSLCSADISHCVQKSLLYCSNYCELFVVRVAAARFKTDTVRERYCVMCLLANLASIASPDNSGTNNDRSLMHCSGALGWTTKKEDCLECFSSLWSIIIVQRCLCCSLCPATFDRF